MSLTVLILERPGWWRSAGLAAVSAAALLPVLPLLAGIFHIPLQELLNRLTDFSSVLGQSLGISLMGAAIALVLGLTAGIMHSLYSFRGAGFFQFVFLLPVMVPPLLWAVGLENFSIKAVFNPAAGGTSSVSLFQGEAGVALISAMISFPLVTFATMSACSVLNRGQCDAARLAGGEWRLLRLAASFALPAALLAACLGGCLMLSCPGPGLALGAKSAVSEILVSFSALYDARLAALQCVSLSAAVLCLAVCAMMLTGGKLVEILAVNARGVRPRSHAFMSRAAFMFSLCCSLVFVLLPLLGLLLPALAVPDLSSLREVLSRTMPDTLLYAMGSASVATSLGLAAAFFMGKSVRHRNTGACIMLVIFSLPAALTALGFLQAGADAPAWTDFLFRSPAAVCLAQGIRLFPLPALLAARLFSSLPASWSWAAELHGISLPLFMKRIAGPMLVRPVVTGFMLTFLLAEADVGTVLLLHPPGAQNLPLAIFTIMANAPRALVAQLGVAYIVFALFLLLFITMIWNRKEKWQRR